MERSWGLIPETSGSTLEGTICYVVLHAVSYIFTDIASIAADNYCCCFEQEQL